jgi:hypothetical protein
MTECFLEERDRFLRPVGAPGDAEDVTDFEVVLHAVLS